MDEGYIKFNCLWKKALPVPEEKLKEIDFWRDIMFLNGLIGVYEDGIGYGNMSIRDLGNDFIITGSATGRYEKLTTQHYTRVTSYDFQQNRLTCEGPIKASSESLSHAIIYECSSDTRAVIHIHHLELWKHLLDQAPTTSKDVAFGTPEMASEIRRLFTDTDVESQKILVMGGHTEGLISFGKTPEEAGKILLANLKDL